MKQNSKAIVFFILAGWCFFLAGCNKQFDVPEAEEVKALTQKVADWQIKTFDEQGKYRALPKPKNRKKWHTRNRYHDLEWEPAAFYVGLFQFTTITNDLKYIDWLNSMGLKHNWKLHRRMFHADDHAVGQFYLSLYEVYRKGQLIKPTRSQFDQILASEKRDDWLWHWCDALFMSPPVWTKLSKLTGDPRYLNFMDEQYHRTYNNLWSKKDNLFFRDKSFIGKKEKNGENLFWARGNGWVFAGLALMIPDFPENWEGKDFYIDIFKKMAAKLKDIQRPDGTWSSGLLGDIKDYPVIETSGTAFFTYGLAWGLNNGILDRKIYEPVLIRAWHALANAVTEEGMLGYVQPVGAAPGISYPNFTELYGSGAFLAAGTEMYKFLKKYYAPDEKKEVNKNYLTFMEKGGWCWYQDPRAVISNGKLVIGGIDGQKGDVRVGVFDLKTMQIDGVVTLHEDFQADDHDTPAFFVRPDGSLLAMWAKHANEKIHYYSISSPDNYLEWGERRLFKHNYEHRAGVTYMNLYYLKDEKKLFNFFRDGLTFNPAFITSDDFGLSWGNRTHFIVNDISGRNRPYARYCQINDNTVGVSYTDAHPRVYGNNLYYAEFRNGSFYTVDGTKIWELGDGPLPTSKGEMLYQGSQSRKKPQGFESVPNSAWTVAIAKDHQNHPHIGYSVYLNNYDHRFRIASWNGEKWIDREIAYAGKCLYYWESSYTGLMAFDPSDPSMVYISTDVDPTSGEDLGGKHEIYEARVGINDDISSIEWKPVTANSQYRNIRPIVVVGEGYKVLLWLNGEWKSYVNYDVDVIGKILEHP